MKSSPNCRPLLAMALSLGCQFWSVDVSEVDAWASSSTSAVRGLVITADESPIAGAKVSLIRTNGGEQKSILTASDGRFSFDGVSAGWFLLHASHEGYVAREYGGSKYGSSGNPIVVEGSSNIDALILKLFRGGTVAGTVRKPNGEPMAGMRVDVVGPLQRDQDEKEQVAKALTSDSAGAFAATGLPPGEYVIRAFQPRNTIISPSGVGDAKRLGYGVTYFPSASDRAAAEQIHLQADGNRGSLDITMVEVETSQVVVEVSVESERFRDIDLGGMSLIRDDVDVAPLWPSNVGGKWLFRDVLPGDYVVRARVGGQQVLAAEASVTVGPGVQTQVALLLRPLVNVTCDVSAKATSSTLPTVRVTLLRPNGTRVGTALSRGPAVVLRNVVPGVYRVRVLIEGPDAERWSVTSLRSRDQIVTDKLAIAPGGDYLEISVTDSVGSLAGLIRDATGPVTAYTLIARKKSGDADERFQRVVRPATTGEFRFTALPPGDYLLSVIRVSDDDDSQSAGHGRVQDSDAAISVRIVARREERIILEIR